MPILSKSIQTRSVIECRSSNRRPLRFIDLLSMFSNSTRFANHANSPNACVDRATIVRASEYVAPTASTQCRHQRHSAPPTNRSEQEQHVAQTKFKPHTHQRQQNTPKRKRPSNEHVASPTSTRRCHQQRRTSPAKRGRARQSETQMPERDNGHDNQADQQARPTETTR